MIPQAVRQLVSVSMPYFSSAAVLATLGGIGLWGHLNHWKLSHADSDSDHASVSATHSAEVTQEKSAPTVTAAKHVTPAPAKLPRVKPEFETQNLALASKETITKAGIEVVEARETPVDHSVTATGIIDYNQTRRAQLSSRVPGIAWRVEKRAGQTVHKGDVLAIVEAVDVGTAKSEFLKSLAHIELKAKVLARLDASVVATRQIQEVEAQLREAGEAQLDHRIRGPCVRAERVHRSSPSFPP